MESECPASPLEFCSKSTEEQDHCEVLNCPASLPFKCPSGLCVSDEKHCPVQEPSVDSISLCKSVSSTSGIGMPIPCANGKCVSSPGQCEPLYECSLKDSSLPFRCPDGTCRASQEQCPHYHRICPTFTPYMCTNGVCAQSLSHCL